MIINMQDDLVLTIDQIKEFLKLNSDGTKFVAENKSERNLWIENVLNKFRYFSCKKKEKTIIKNYIARMTSLSKTQVKKLIARKRKFGKIISSYSGCHRFSKKYDAFDIALLIKTDNLHGRISGPATKGILAREYGIFNKQDYRNISSISASHIYNLRKTRQYVSHSLTVKKTNAVKVLIGQRMKPKNDGLPGYLRIDTVHQGDLEKEKGVYHINVVDEVLQWEIVGCVERISVAGTHFLDTLYVRRILKN